MHMVEHNRGEIGVTESEREKQRQQFGLPKKRRSGGRLLKRTDTDPEEREDNEKWTAVVSEVKQRTDGD